VFKIQFKFKFKFTLKSKLKFPFKAKRQLLESSRVIAQATTFKGGLNTVWVVEFRYA
jgi:hypothetical protein